MKAIVTRQNVDGTFDEVGMNNRIVLGPYTWEQFICKKAAEFAGKGRGYRIEFFPDSSILGEPIKVVVRH